MKKIRTILNSFHLREALEILLLYTIRKIFRLDVKYSFAQTGEDSILQAIFGTEHQLFYVDVGCNDPFNNSNTMNMYINGGRGICIDANSELIKKFRKKRPKDIVVESVVSNVVEEVDYFIFTDNLISTISVEEYETNLQKSEISRIDKKITRTLTNILEEYLPENQLIDILSLDVEGHDFQVLQSIDLNRYRPKVILVEIHKLKLGDSSFECNEIIKYLKKYDFQLKYYATMNAYFIDTRE